MSREQDLNWLLREKYQASSEAELSPAAREQFYNDTMRYDHNDEPIEYIVGWTEFLDCKIYLDSTPLIPRTETEFWTEKAIEEIKKYVGLASVKEAKVLDLCAGSGCIGIAVAKAVPEACIDFAEIDPAHLPTIEKNLHHNLTNQSSRSCLERTDQCQIVQSDLFKNLCDKPDASGTSSRQDLELGTYDFILSNPPYIDPVLDRTQSSVKDFEPHQALYGGANGMEIIIRIIEQSLQHLKPSGQLWIEHEPEQSKEIRTLAEKHGFSATTHTDQYGTERYSVLVVE